MRKSSLLIALVLAWSSLAVPGVAGVLQVPLMVEFDQFGNQIETIQGFDDGTNIYTAFSLYDTGASVVTLSYTDRMSFSLDGETSPIPIKVPGGAAADGINGGLIGDVSAPGTVLADGMHAVQITMNGIMPDLQISFANAATVPGVQMFVGASPGSTALPTITGTPIHYPTAAHPNGTAARINMTGYELDLGELFPEFGPLFEGMIVYMPDIHFVPSGGTIAATTETTEVARIPLAMFGDVNHPEPGDMITVAPNPVVEGAVTLQHQPGAEPFVVSGKTFLFDTGAQLSIVSPEIAEGLGLDLDAPEWSIDVQGAAGQPVSVPGYAIDVLELPRDDDGDGVVDGVLQFTNVPIHVLDLGFGLDGILGMNLFNTAVEMLYDPFDPDGASVRLTFDPDPSRQVPDETDQSALALFAGLFPMFAGALGVAGSTVYLPNFELQSVPEPSTLLLLALGAVAMLIVRRRGNPV